MRLLAHALAQPSPKCGIRLPALSRALDEPGAAHDDGTHGAMTTTVAVMLRVLSSSKS